MENAITADVEKITHHICYDILQNLYEKNKDNNESKTLIEKIQKTAQELLDVTFTKKKYKVDPLWVSLVYNEDNKDVITSIYRNIVQEVTSRLDIELVINPSEEKLQEVTKNRHNYFVMTDTTFSNLIESLEVLSDNKEEAKLTHTAIIENNSKKNVSNTAVGSSDMLLVTEMEEVPFNEAAHYMYHLGSIENSPFKNVFKEQPIISLPLIENSLLLSLAGRSNLLVYEIGDNPELNLNQESSITSKIKNIRNENFNHTQDNSSENKLN